jgi:hypothetical protein
MFGSFTTRRNFGNQLFPSRTLGQFGGASSAIAGNFLNAAGITDPTISTAINQLVIDLLNFNILHKFYAIYPFVGGSATSCKFNLINPADTNEAFRLNFVGGWTFSANGALPNGTNAYANTFLSPAITFNLNSHSFGIYSRTNNITGVQIVLGCTDSGFTNFIQNNITVGNLYSGGLSTGFFSYTAAPTTSLIMGTRTSNTLFKGFRSGVLLGSNTNSISALPNVNVYLGARNNNPTPVSFSLHQLAFAFFGDGLNDQESQNFNTIIQTFQTTLSRQV